MKKLLQMGIFAATLFTMALAPLAQASAAGYGQSNNYGSGYYGQNYHGGGGYYAQHKKGYKHKRGYKKHGRIHRCETKRYRWSKSCRHYHRHQDNHRGWRR